MFDRAFAGRAWLLLVGTILMLQAVLVLRHVPWLDEWQALQISLQSPDFGALLENLRYEGHPPLWYLLLQGAAQIVPVRAVLPAVALPIALATQALLLLSGPFTRLERVLLSTSFFFLFDFTVLSRSLGLGVLLTLVAIAWRRHWTGWIALALLPMVDFLFGVLSIGFLIIAWRERRLWTPGLVLWLFCGLCAAWTVRPATDIIPAFWLNGPLLDSLIFLSRLGALFLPLHILDGTLVWNQTPPMILALPSGIGWLFLGRKLLRGDGLGTVLFFSFTLITFLFSIIIYPLAIRHLSLGVLLLVLLIWRRDEAEQNSSGFFLVWLAIASACGLLTAGVNLIRPFDTAPQVARYIIDHDLVRRHWVSFPDSRAQGVSALLGIEFERVERKCTQSFIRWNYRTRIESLADLEEELANVATRQGSFHLLTDFRINSAKLDRPNDYRLLTHIAAGYDGQAYYLYQVRPDLPERPQRPPQCAPRRLPLKVMP